MFIGKFNSFLIWTIFGFISLNSVKSIEEGDNPNLYFVKDEGMDTKFPPTLVRTSFEEIPLGHLRSLGYQRASDGPTDHKKVNTLSSRQFFDNYVNRNLPVTIKSAIDEKEPIRSTWTDDRLKKIHGNAKVWVIKRHERSSKHPMRKTLERFLEFYKLQDVYIATTVPDELLKELFYPQFMDCDVISNNLIEAELWMAYGGTGSLLHYHGDHQVHCLADGRQDYILIANKYKNLLKMNEKHPFTGEGHSPINTEMINMFEEKQLADVPWTYSTLMGGDCVFIPAGYIHQVRSFGRSLSYTIQFSAFTNESTSQCSEKVEDNYQKKSLDLLEFIYTDQDGHEQLKNTKLGPSDLRRILLKLIRKAAILPFERFQYFYNIAIAKKRNKMPSAQVAFSNIDVNNRGHLTLEEIQQLPDLKLQKITNILNSIHRKGHDEL